jgi:outer membrane protein assembly factor BamB
MKRKTFIMCMAVACLAFLLLLSACAVADGEIEGDTTRPEEESYEMPGDEFKMTGRLYFGKDNSQALLLDSNGVLIWHYPVKSGMFDSYDTGDTVTVVHGPVMLSLPGQTNVSYVSLISNGDESVFTEEELAEIMKVIEGFR